jgi:hypothetical protein
MIFLYRSTLVNSATGGVQNLTTSVDTDRWFQHMRTDKYGLYGNSADLVEEHVLPALAGNDIMAIAAIASTLDEQWRKHNRVAIFELAMFVWAGFKAGMYSAEAWAAVLAIAWQSGSRGMLATMRLSQAQVIEMFKAAPMHVIHKIVSHSGHDVQAEYDALPDTIDVARGVSTGIDHYEDGFSWTRDAEEIIKFAALNCHTKKEIPGFLRATIPRSAILAMFSFESEVVVDPTVKKLNVEKHFLRGAELRDFHANIDVEANTQDILFKTGYHNKRMAAALPKADDIMQAEKYEDDWEQPALARTGPKNIFEK